MDEVLASKLGYSEFADEASLIKGGCPRRDLADLIHLCRHSDSTKRPSASSLHLHLSNISKIFGDPRPVGVYQNAADLRQRLRKASEIDQPISSSASVEEQGLRLLSEDFTTINEPIASSLSAGEHDREFLSKTAGTTASFSPTHTSVVVCCGLLREDTETTITPTPTRVSVEEQGLGLLSSPAKACNMPSLFNTIAGVQGSGFRSVPAEKSGSTPLSVSAAELGIEPLSTAAEATDTPFPSSASVEEQGCGVLSEDAETTDLLTPSKVSVEERGSGLWSTVAEAIDSPTSLCENVEAQDWRLLSENVEGTVMPTPSIVCAEEEELSMGHFSTVAEATDSLTVPSMMIDEQDAAEFTDIESPTSSSGNTEERALESFGDAAETNDLPTSLSMRGEEVIIPCVNVERKGSGFLSKPTEITAMPILSNACAEGLVLQLFSTVAEANDSLTVHSMMIEEQASGAFRTAAKTTESPSPTRVSAVLGCWPVKKAAETTDSSTSLSMSVVELDCGDLSKAGVINDSSTQARVSVDDQGSGLLREAAQPNDTVILPNVTVEENGSGFLSKVSEPSSVTTGLRVSGILDKTTEITGTPTFSNASETPLGVSGAKKQDLGLLVMATEVKDASFPFNVSVEKQGPGLLSEAAETTDSPIPASVSVDEEGSRLLMKAIEPSDTLILPSVSVDEQGSGRLSKVAETTNFAQSPSGVTLKEQVWGRLSIENTTDSLSSCNGKIQEHRSESDFCTPLSASTPRPVQANYNEACEKALRKRYDDALRIYGICYEAMKRTPELGVDHSDTLNVHSKLLLTRIRSLLVSFQPSAGED